jgi:hypothetical protein
MLEHMLDGCGAAFEPEAEAERVDNAGPVSKTVKRVMIFVNR